MENSLAVANYFVNKANEEGVELTPMKLIKLVYIAHGWHLAIKNDPLIDEGVQAWKYGPVVVSVYDSFKEYGKKLINRPAYIFTFSPQVEYFAPNINNAETKEFLDNVWRVYSKYDGLQLSALTHQPNTPWYITWHQNGGKDQTAVVIPNNLIKTHYVDKMKVDQQNVNG